MIIIIISLILSFIFGALLMFLVFCIVAPLKDKKPKNNVHFYVARDQDGLLWLYLGKPVRYFEVFRVNTYNGAKVLTPHIKDFGLNKEDYADLKWEDEPVEVFLNLKN